MKKMKKGEQPEKMEIGESSVKVQNNMPSESYILSGRDRDQIHKQNLDILKTMSEEEIIEEQQKLIATIDPAIVAFLKTKRKELENTQTNLPTISQIHETESEIKIEEIELLKQPDADKWIHFDSIETSKFAWMKTIEIPSNTSDTYEARFDFAGWLLPFSDSEINEKNRILYHHGEEPGRPGYTLQELFQLAR